jgi:hypothetical protein
MLSHGAKGLGMDRSRHSRVTTAVREFLGKNMYVNICMCIYIYAVFISVEIVYNDKYCETKHRFNRFFFALHSLPLYLIISTFNERWILSFTIILFSPHFPIYVFVQIFS